MLPRVSCWAVDKTLSGLKIFKIYFNMMSSSNTMRASLFQKRQMFILCQLIVNQEVIFPPNVPPLSLFEGSSKIIIHTSNQ